MVPVALAKIQNPNELAQPGSVQLDAMLGPRPPLVDDFWEEKLSHTVEVRSYARVVKITAEVLTVPRLI